MGVFKVTYTRGGQSKKTKKWYGYITPVDGPRRRVPLCGDKRAAEAMLADMQRETDRATMGFRRVEEVADLLKRFESHLCAKGRSERHVTQTLSQLRLCLADVGAKTSSDLDAAKVIAWLELRRREPLAVRRRGRAEEPFSIGTCNHYIRGLKTFGRWMTSAGLSNPFAALATMNAKPDARVTRRAISAEELARLIAITETLPDRYSLTGKDRSLLYHFAATTGLRAGEIRSLTPASFDLKSCAVSLKAANEKSRRGATLPLHPDLVIRLRAWLSGRKECWPGQWHLSAAKMLRHDLTAAGIPFEDGHGGVFDFHALRGQFITDLGRAGVPLVAAQKLARHSTPMLTSNHYTHLDLDELADQVAKLGQPEGASSADLNRVIAAWPALAEEQRGRILAIVSEST